MLEPGQRLWCLARLAEVVGTADASLSQLMSRDSDDPGDLHDAPQPALLWLSDIKTQTERVQRNGDSEPRRRFFFLCEMMKTLVHYFGYISTLALASFVVLLRLSPWKCAGQCKLDLGNGQYIFFCPSWTQRNIFVQYSWHSPNCFVYMWSICQPF